jgi:signal transduction histidine kinase
MPEADRLLSSQSNATMPDTAIPPLKIFSTAVLRRLLMIFLPAAVVLGGVVFLLHTHDLANEVALAEQAGTHLVELQEDIIRRELRSVESDVLYLANQAVLRDYLSGRQANKKELQQEYVLFCRQRKLYDQIRYLDQDGLEIIRINDNKGNPRAVADADLQPKADRYYFSEAMRLDQGEVFISRFDLNVEHDAIERPLKPVIRFATPVFDRGGRKRGVLVLNYLGDALIQKLTAVRLNFPGSTLLLNRAGYFLHGGAAGEDWAFMFGNDRTFASRYPEEWQAISRSSRGHLHTAGGLFTFRTLSPGQGWWVVGSGRTPSPPVAATSDAGVTVVSHISPSAIHARSAEQLLRILFVAGPALVLVFVLAWYLAYAAALRRRHEERLTESENRLRKLSTQLLTAQEDERRSLSRDLHDDLGQLVTAVLLDLQRATLEKEDGKRSDLIGRGLHGAECLLERLHEIASRIRPTLLDDLGLKEAVQSLLSEYERRTGIVPRLDLHFDRQDLPPAVSENVYRILQEALTNVARHSRASEVFVTIYAEAARVTLVVGDEGAGFDPEVLEGKGLGILGMRERAELLGGSFALRAKPGNGTWIEVVFPIAGG